MTVAQNETLPGLMVAGLNAQEVGAIDAAAAGIVEGGTVLAAGTVLAETPSIVMQ